MTTPAQLFDLTGKTAIVTGGSRGLGAEIVKAYAEAGADVMIVSRKLDSCVELADEVRTATGRKAVPYAAHMGDWAQIGELVEAAYGEFAKIDILVNNAGMSPLYGDKPSDVTETLWDKVFGVNVKGPFRLAALVGDRMVAAGSGSIINVSSGGSIRPRPNILPYASAKAGLNAATIGLAHAFGPTVRVNCIMPGPFLTDISNAWDMDRVNARQQAYALQRCGYPNEIVGAALYFASDASTFTTGAILPVDGGMP